MNEILGGYVRRRQTEKALPHPTIDGLRGLVFVGYSQAVIQRICEDVGRQIAQNWIAERADRN